MPAQPANQPWPEYPALYEINTWIWLSALNNKYGSALDLGSVPAAEWDAIAAFGFDAVWLMGVWERSPASIAIANENASLVNEFHRTLSDFQPEDNVGSPYGIRRYVVDQHLGGVQGLAQARKELAKRGIRLILDFVPNHVSPDHPWVTEHPEYFILGNVEDAAMDPASYLALNGFSYARGRDPYFPAWPDVLQLNAFRPELRQEAIDTISEIARQCDGVRCDMAMLLLNRIFERTWGSRAGQAPITEYWGDVIPRIKQTHPDFLFIAEAYWDLEWRLQQLGFDFCYDKRLYDRLQHESAESVRLHLSAEPAYLRKLLHFIENHDEPRAAATFSPSKARAVAVATFTVPGARLFQEGQFEGRKIRPPVFLGRRPDEPADEELQNFYRKLLDALRAPAFREGEWRLCECSGWPDNPSYQNLLAWSWTKDDEHYLIAVNLSDNAVQAMIHAPVATAPETGGKSLRLVDVLSGDHYDRDRDILANQGLYVELRAWNFHFLHCCPHI